MKRTIILLILLLFSVTAYGQENHAPNPFAAPQVSSSMARKIRTVTSLPSTCAATGSVDVAILRTGSVNTLYICGDAANNWKRAGNFSAASSTDNAIARYDGTAGNLQNSLVTIDDVGAIGLPDGVRQTFNPNGTNAGLNVGAQAGDPSSLSNGDIWYDSSGHLLRARVNGASLSLGQGITNGAGANTLPKSDGTNLVASRLNDSGATITLGSLTNTSMLKLTSSTGLSVLGDVNDSDSGAKISVDNAAATITFTAPTVRFLGLSATANFEGLTASRLVATDASKNLVSTISSANMAASVTDETGTDKIVFSGSPNFTGTVGFAGATSGTSSITAPPVAGTVTNTLPGTTGTLTNGSDPNLAAFPNIPSAVTKAVFSSNVASGNVDLYTAPANTRAMVLGIVAANQGANANVVWFPELKSAGTYYRLNGNQTATNTGVSQAAAGNIILEPGESFAVNTDNTGVNIWAHIVEFPETFPFKTVKLTTLSIGDNTLYTVPASITATLLPTVLPANSLLLHGYYNTGNSSGGSRTYLWYAVPSAGAAAAGNRFGPSAGTSAANNAMGLVVGPKMLSAGTFVVVNTDAGTATQMAWINVWER